jgi:ABC-type dipeptide/oligopeptide/nickel transport system permease subunit
MADASSARRASYGWLAIDMVGGGRRGMVVVALIVLVVTLCIAGPHWWPIQYDTTDFNMSSQGPSAIHPLGTDVFGRDLLARLLVGTRSSLVIALSSQVLAVCIGIAFGLIAGTGRISDSLVMRGIDILMAVPDILLVILLVPLFGSALGSSAISDFLEPVNDLTSGGVGIVLAITLCTWMLTARLVRAQVLSLREAEFYRAAIVTGASRQRLMAVHLLPNVMPVAVTAFTLGVPRAILLESAIAYLGLGLIAPMPSIGILIADGVKVMRSHPFALIVPAIVLCALVTGISVLGDMVREYIQTGTGARA